MNTIYKEQFLQTLKMQDPYFHYFNQEIFPSFGWNSDSPCFSLAKTKTRCLEIGSWMGGSARTLCSIIPSDGVLVCCDTFLGSHEHFIDKTVPLNGYGKPMLYECFLTNTQNEKEKIIPLMLSSSSAMEVFRRLGVAFDFIYIDGDHRENAVYNDVKESYERLNSNGVIVGDDYTWGTVQDGLNRAKQELGIDYQVNGNNYIIVKE